MNAICRSTPHGVRRATVSPRNRIRKTPGQHKARPLLRTGPMKRLLSILTNPWARISRLRPQILLGAIRLDLAVHEEPRWRQCDRRSFFTARLVFLGVGTFWRPTIHTDRYRSVTWIHPNSALKTAVKLPFAPIRVVVSSEYRRPASVVPNGPPSQS